MTVLTSADAAVHVEHTWQLRDEEFEDGHSIRRFECTDCDEVRFE